MKEDSFVATAMNAAEEVVLPPLLIRRGASLLYQVTVDNRLRIEIDPKRPVRGRSAFQTDLAVFERVDEDVEIPRVVMEFKPRLSTHDVLIYSSKARRHKQVYPYLRYGLVLGTEKRVPSRFFTHNEGLDFCLAAAEYKRHRLHEVIVTLLKAEVDMSRELEEISFGKQQVHLYRTSVRTDGVVQQIR